jgi:DNA-binding CsgD family transcriptional regulator
VLLLIKSGRFGAATQTADTLPGSLKLLPLARIHLWAGNYEQAIRLADGAPFEAGLDLGDQYRLKLLHVAAALVEGSCDSDLRTAGINELQRMLENEAFLPLALLPRLARDALVDLYRAEDHAEDVNFQLLLERLQQVNDAGGLSSRPFRLTEREVILLPLLATDMPVPDIARSLHVSVNTVRKQVVTLREKFQADTRAELIRKAMAYGALQSRSITV